MNKITSLKIEKLKVENEKEIEEISRLLDKKIFIRESLNYYRNNYTIHNRVTFEEYYKYIREEKTKKELFGSV